MVNAHEFAMPSLGADMDDGVIVSWLVQPGDRVVRGQIIAVVETDKSDIDVEIFQDAVIEELLVPEGERVNVGAPIARLAGIGDGGRDETTAVTAESDGSRVITSPVLRRLADRLELDARRIAGTGIGGRVLRDDLLRAAEGQPRPRITPRARRVAREVGIDPADVAVTSVVTADDVLAAARTRRGDAPARPDRAAVTSPDAFATSTGPDRAAMRAHIAAQMERSWAEIPHFHITSRIDLTDALEQLEHHNSTVGPAERIVPAALLLCAVARVARRVPAVNGWWSEGVFSPSETVDLGVVVAVRGGGIIVPTIGAADGLNAVEMMGRLAGVVGRAKARRLRTADAASASLTVTNLGDLGAESVHGVIHAPQVALVGFGAIGEEVLAVEGLIGIRRVVSATLSGDHRSFDGMVAARFLGDLASEIAGVAAELDRVEPHGAVK
jgi:pyruvate dehydrogenase E2 component (dihydrolipoamide acetyltransferase)